MTSIRFSLNVFWTICKETLNTRSSTVFSNVRDGIWDKRLGIDYDLCQRVLDDESISDNFFCLSPDSLKVQYYFYQLLLLSKGS